ncbi:MAG: FkbM family methyltransferase [Inquilinaceae bacterium]
MPPKSTSGPASASRDTARLVRVLAHRGITLVADVGANVGQYATRLRQGGYGGRMVSFEPLAEAHAALTAAAADDPGWIVAPPQAIGDSGRPVTINVSAESDMSSILAFRPEMETLLSSATYVDAVTVPQARLDEALVPWIEPDDRILLKIDTQGYERPVLAGAAGLMDRIDAIQIEMAIIEVYDGEPSYLAMIELLAGLGYHPVLFIPGYFNRRTARMMQMDGVFVRREGG